MRPLSFPVPVPVGIILATPAWGDAWIPPILVFPLPIVSPMGLFGVVVMLDPGRVSRPHHYRGAVEKSCHLH